MNELSNFDPQTLHILAKSFKDGLPLPSVKEIFLIESLSLPDFLSKLSHPETAHHYTYLSINR